MSDPTSRDTDETRPRGLIDRHPQLGIYLIAGVFYVILFGMCAFVAVVIWA